MSFEFSTGILPTGAYDPGLPNLSGYPYRVPFFTVPVDVHDYMGASRVFWVTGSGDPRRVPQEFMAIAFAKEWSFDISLSGLGGTKNWTGTLKRGVTRLTTGAETGTLISTHFDAFSLGVIPPETVEATYKTQSASYVFSETTGGVFSSLAITFDPRSAVYVTADDSWVFPLILSASIGGSEEGAFTAISTSAGLNSPSNVSGISIIDQPFLINGVGVTSLAGAFTPISWLS